MTPSSTVSSLTLTYHYQWENITESVAARPQGILLVAFQAAVVLNGL
jgi:hypothetical protein